MNAAEVRAALAKRWPDDQYLSIPEAPQDAMRQGRKIDLLVVSLWRSRGFERDAVEIKVSLSDWRRELDRADKADWWWAHSGFDRAIKGLTEQLEALRAVAAEVRALRHPQPGQVDA